MTCDLIRDIMTIVGLAFRLKHLNIKVTFCAVLRLDFVAVSKSNEAFFVFFCARNYMLKVFKERSLSFEVL